MRRWDGLVDGYTKECEVRGLSAAVVYGIRREMDRCGNWLKRRRPKVDLEKLEATVLMDYLRKRSAFHAKSTLSASVSKLRGMGEYLVREGIWLKNPMRWVKGPKLDPRMRLPRRIEQGDMRRLWAEAGNRSEEKRAAILCVLGILYGTGVRRGELERLNLSDWDRETGTLKIDGRKVGRERKVPVGPGVWRCVEAYLPKRQNRLEACGRLDETAFLVNRTGERLTGEAISQMVKNCAKAAGIEFVSLHQFRHSCAADLLESGATMPEVKSILGHAVIESTMRYYVQGVVM